MQWRKYSHTSSTARYWTRVGTLREHLVHRSHCCNPSAMLSTTTRFMRHFSLILTRAMHWQRTGSETPGHRVYKVRGTVYVNACWCNKFINRRWNLNYFGEAVRAPFETVWLSSNCGQAFEHFSQDKQDQSWLRWRVKEIWRKLKLRKRAKESSSFGIILKKLFSLKECTNIYIYIIYNI